jgi:hypothetical protein
VVGVKGHVDAPPEQCWCITHGVALISMQKSLKRETVKTLELIALNGLYRSGLHKLMRVCVT